MKRLALASFLVLNCVNAYAFETDAGCQKTIFSGMTEYGERVELCLLRDNNFHFNLFGKGEEEKPRVHFDIERNSMAFSSVGSMYDYRISFTFVENDLTYMLYNHTDEDDDITPLISIVTPNNESIMHDYIIPSTFRVSYDIDDIRGLTK